MLEVWYVDALSNEFEFKLIMLQDLCAAALLFAYDTLKVGGHFVCKFYQGGEDKEFEAHLKKIFEVVHREKPESSRSVGSLF